MPDLTIHLPEVPPLGWPITRHTVEDMWRLFVAPNEHETGPPSPEVRALAALLTEVYQALPANPEPRRYRPTISEPPVKPVRFRLDDLEDDDA